MVNGVTTDLATIIEDAQPYKHTPHAPAKDPLWILQDLNNTDKHRLIPVSVLGIGSVDIYDRRGKLAILTSEDVVLEYDKVFWSFFTPNGRYDDVYAEIACIPAFEQTMSIGTGITLSMSGMLWHIADRVHRIIENVRPKFV